MARRRSKRSVRRSSSMKASTILLSIGAGSLIALVVVAVVLVARGDGESISRNKPQTPVVTSAPEVRVGVIDNDYEPRDLTVARGATVTWDFTGNLPHTVTADDGSFSSGILNEGQRFVVTLDEPGTFTYYCTLHHAMQGKVVVRE